MEWLKQKIRKYTVEINREGRILKHNSDDWRKSLAIKRLCKHLVKVLMIIDVKESRKILTDILENKDRWRFQLSD